MHEATVPRVLSGRAFTAAEIELVLPFTHN
jgi:hypothetical protein